LGMTLAVLVFEICSLCIFDILSAVLSAVCFPAHMTIQTADKRQIAMSQLQIGDRISDGHGDFSEVYFFSHQHKTVPSLFAEIKLRNDKTLMASLKHFLPVSAQCNDVRENMYAYEVKPGMCLYSLDETTGRMEMVPVEETGITASEGLYNPFTMSGELMVNGVLASSHADWFLNVVAEAAGMTKYLPGVYQAIMGPGRALYKLVGAEIARRELKDMQATLDEATSNKEASTHYLHVLRRAAYVLPMEALKYVGWN